MTKNNEISKGFHERNKHNSSYDFDALIQSYPALKSYVAPNKFGNDSIVFSDPKAVLALNKAILLHFYKAKWDIPTGYLCPPVPGRADYLHQIADLLSESNKGEIPQGDKVKGWDIGIGANCIYPIVGIHEYDWSFIGSDVDARALKSVEAISNLNPSIKEKLTTKLQNNKAHILPGILEKGEVVDFTICNPPFHNSIEEALKGTQRKNKNLGIKTPKNKESNFRGKNNELVFRGGEQEFITMMIEQSAKMPTKSLWYTSLVASKAHLSKLLKVLKRTRVRHYKVIEMQHGQKTSRIIAWTFLNHNEREEWAKKRWS